MSDYTKPTRVRVNPSRHTCEEIIRRILLTETKENGSNRHFKTGADFMTYFESLYPSGPALTKQVQRAIRSMGLAKDQNGYFLIDKTKEEQATEQELKSVLEKSDADITNTGTTLQTLLITCSEAHRRYLMTLIPSCHSLSPLCVTMTETNNGILIFTPDAGALNEALADIMD